MENLKLLFQIYFRPASSFSEILDKGSWLFAAVAVLVVSAAFFLTVNSRLETAYHVPAMSEFYQPDLKNFDEDSPAAEALYKKAVGEYQTALAQRPKIPLVGDSFFKFFSFAPRRFYQPLLALSIFYVPAAILLICLFAALGNFGVIFQRSYGELATCTLMAWAAAHLPFAVAGILLYSSATAPFIWLLMWLLSSILFSILMFFALRVVFGANDGAAILTVATAWFALTVGMYVFLLVSPLLFSPFLLIYGYLYFGGAISGGITGAGGAFRQKQNFKRFLHNATVNPKDADAHVQLGLIYLRRRQHEKALDHFKQAVVIDPEEIDANYELGKFARLSGEFQSALDYFVVVVGQNDKYALSEIWREIGATYLAAQMPAEACEALEKFVERRPVDAEGLYHLGKVYQARNEPEKAREMFTQAIESAKSSPDFRRRDLKHWSKLAQKETSAKS